MNEDPTVLTVGGLVSRYRFILADADMTLFDFERAEHHAYFESWRRAGLGEANEEIYKIYHTVNQSLWEALERGEISRTDLVVERHRRTFERVGVDYDAARFNGFYLQALSESGFLLPGAEAFCAAVQADVRTRGGGLYIVTNGVKTVQLGRFEHSPLRRYVDGIFISEEIGCNKPDARYFELVLARLPDFDPESGKPSVLVIGDSPTSDILGANNAGLDSLWLNPRRLPPGAAKPLWVCEKLGMGEPARRFSADEGENK